MPRSRPATTAAAALVPVAVGCVLYWAPLVEGQAFLDRDIVGLVYGNAEAFVSCFRAGSWPLWNPWLGFGQPLLADPSHQALYPTTWLGLLLPVTTWFAASVLLHAGWGATGMAWLARRLGLPTLASVVAAVLWLGAAPLLSIVDLWQHFDGAAWLPWTALCAWTTTNRPTARNVVAWALVLTVQVLCGSVEMLLLGGALAASVVLAARPQGGSGWMRLRAVASAGAIAVGLSAVQWLPALALLLSSDRPHQPVGAATAGSLQPAQILQLLLPVRASEVPLPPATRAALLGGTQPLQDSLYLGATSLALVLAAFHGRGRRAALVLLAVATSALVLALGDHTPLLSWLVQLVPPLRIFRYPAKLTILLVCAWTLLAAFGAASWARRPAAGPRAWLLGVASPMIALALALAGAAFATGPLSTALAPLLDPGLSGTERAAALTGVHLRLTVAAGLAAVVALLALAGAAERRRAAAGIAVVAAVALDVAFANRALSPTIPAWLLERPPATAAAMPRDTTTRLHALGTNSLLAVPWRGLSAPQAWAVGVQEAMAGTTPIRWGYSLSFGGDFIVTPLPGTTSLTRAFQSQLGSVGAARLLARSGVSWVVAQDPTLVPTLDVVSSVLGPWPRPVYILRVPRSLPRAYVVGAAEVADDSRALALMASESFDALQRVVLADGEVAHSRAFHGRAQLLEHRPDRVEIETETAEAGHVVLLDAWDEGWRASVDGIPVRVKRANAAFRAVAVPPGKHRVTMVYRPRSVVWGLALSTVTAAALLLGSAVVGRLRTG